jgi:hypothetical protein
VTAVQVRVADRSTNARLAYVPHSGGRMGVLLEVGGRLLGPRDAAAEGVEVLTATPEQRDELLHGGFALRGGEKGLDE